MSVVESVNPFPSGRIFGRMEVVVISDVHANRVALEAVLADAGDPDRIVCAGDVVGYNPWPAECIDVLRERSVPTISGNHDRMLTSGRNFGANAMAQAGIRYARDQVNDVQRGWLERLPETDVLFDGRLKLVHGHPDDPDRYTYPEQFGADLLGDEDVLVMGHTHVQHEETFDDGIVVNPGSVGQPRDRDPRAAYAVVDLQTLDVELRRVEYNVERVVDAVRAAGLPRTIGERLRDGR